MSLKDRILDRIKADGPLSVAEYMTLCLLDPVDGYYPTRDPLGSEGDFITAPEISQMFGEVLGLWCVQSWQDIGSPEQVHLIELGPGRGIMMSDMLRAASLDTGFKAAVKVTLIEASAALEAVQGQTLANAQVPVSWAKDISEVPSGPTLLIGNEFLDCLPIRQFIQKDRFAGAAGWRERVVTLDEDTGSLAFAISPTPLSEVTQAALPEAHSAARNDDLLEVCASASLLLDRIKSRFDAAPGRALFIDYGSDATEFGDTLQALKRHEKVGVFSDPGNTDLTARVDFAALKASAKDLGLSSTPIVTQSALLSRLGIEVRAVTLARAKPDAKPKIARQLDRLMGAEQMGTLFKAICFQSDGLSDVLGFE